MKKETTNIATCIIFDQRHLLISLAQKLVDMILSMSRGVQLHCAGRKKLGSEGQVLMILHLLACKVVIFLEAKCPGSSLVRERAGVDVHKAEAHTVWEEAAAGSLGRAGLLIRSIDHGLRSERQNSVSQ